MSLQKISSIQTPFGYPEFVKLEESVKCLICHRVLRDAMQTTCGHRICEDCVPKMFDGQQEPVDCPAKEEDCLKQKPTDITPDPSGRREVRKLRVYCTYKDLGCSIKPLMWKDLEPHVQQCEYRPVDCPNKQYGCNDLIPYLNTQVHVDTHCQYRLIPCQHCNEMIPMIKKEDHVHNECNAVTMTCPYSCGSKPMSRPILNDHKESCTKKPNECKFKSVGCRFTGSEKEVADHMTRDLNAHLEMVTVYTSNMNVQSMQVRRELQEVSSERDHLRLMVMVETQVQELTKMTAQLGKINNGNKELKMKMVSMTERIIHLERRSEDMAKKDVVDRHDRDVRALQTSLTQVRTQVATIERSGNGQGNQNRGTGAGASADVTEATRRVDLHDNQFSQLDIQMTELDLRFQILETVSYDGTLLWKLRDYARRKQDAITAKTLSLYSQPFCTHTFGYKMCARVYLNGDGTGKGSHMSLFFVIMRGEYDNLLPWPFQQKVTMILLDQESGQTHLLDTFRPDPTSNSFKKPTTEMNIASGCPLFVSHVVLETPKYIKDDTIFIKFVVDLGNLNHP